MMAPAHPGDSMLFGCLGVVGKDEGAATLDEAAAKLGVRRKTLRRDLNGDAPVTPALARRLEAVGWSTAEFWRHRQASHDDAQGRLKRRRSLGRPVRVFRDERHF